MSLLWFGRSDAPVNDMLGFAQRHTQQLPPPPRSREVGGGARVDGGCPERAPHCPCPNQRPVGKAAGTATVRDRPQSELPFSAPETLPKSHPSSQSAQNPSSPNPATQECSLPQVRVSPTPVPRAQAAETPSFQPIGHPSWSLPGAPPSAHPESRPGTRHRVPSQAPHPLPGTRGVGFLSGPLDPRRVGLTGPGQILAPGDPSGSGSGCGEPRTGRGRRREQVRRRDSGCREAGPAGAGRGSRGRHEHLGTCSPPVARCPFHRQEGRGRGARSDLASETRRQRLDASLPVAASGCAPSPLPTSSRLLAFREDWDIAKGLGSSRLRENLSAQSLGGEKPRLIAPGLGASISCSVNKNKIFKKAGRGGCGGGLQFKNFISPPSKRPVEGLDYNPQQPPRPTSSFLPPRAFWEL